jgi:hypothetical protein
MEQRSGSRRGPVHERSSRERGFTVSLHPGIGVGALAIAAACGDPPQAADASSTTVDTVAPSTTPTLDTTAGPGSSTTTVATPTGPSSDTGSTASTISTISTTATTATTGSPTCDKNVVLMGYWPPTNEMLRPWSTNPEQNPGGWIGEGWEGYGYDVYSFFPEFPPDGDPSNDPIGGDGAVGSPRYDLRVDYQATSADFWRIVDMLEPVLMVTTSRGGDIGWEVEAIEGGHGGGGSPEFDWSSDQHGPEPLPTEASIEARSWDAISTYRAGNTLPTRLPVDEIVAATTALGLTNVVVDQNTSGNFLSGFLGLHGLYYAEQANYEVFAAGHVHVGYGLPVADASALIEATLHAVLQAHPADRVPCP